jgi:hypothetical protein
LNKINGKKYVGSGGDYCCRWKDNTKRHILAAVQSRLAKFAAVFFGRSSALITNSFSIGHIRHETRTKFDKTKVTKEINLNLDGIARLTDLDKKLELI